MPPAATALHDAANVPLVAQCAGFSPSMRSRNHSQHHSQEPSAGSPGTPGVERGLALGPLEYFKLVSSSENHCRSQAEVLSPSFDGSSR
jgi:hypothetical protein